MEFQEIKIKAPVTNSKANGSIRKSLVFKSEGEDLIDSCDTTQKSDNKSEYDGITSNMPCFKGEQDSYLETDTRGIDCSLRVIKQEESIIESSFTQENENSLFGVTKFLFPEKSIDNPTHLKQVELANDYSEDKPRASSLSLSYSIPAQSFHEQKREEESANMLSFFKIEDESYLETSVQNSELNFSIDDNIKKELKSESYEEMGSHRSENSMTYRPTYTDKGNNYYSVFFPSTPLNESSQIDACILDFSSPDYSQSFTQEYSQEPSFQIPSSRKLSNNFSQLKADTSKDRMKDTEVSVIYIDDEIVPSAAKYGSFSSAGFDITEKLILKIKSLNAERESILDSVKEFKYLLKEAKQSLTNEDRENEVAQKSLSKENEFLKKHIQILIENENIFKDIVSDCKHFEGLFSDEKNISKTIPKICRVINRNDSLKKQCSELELNSGKLGKYLRFFCSLLCEIDLERDLCKKKSMEEAIKSLFVTEDLTLNGLVNKIEDRGNDLEANKTLECRGHLQEETKVDKSDKKNGVHLSCQECERKSKILQDIEVECEDTKNKYSELKALNSTLEGELVELRKFGDNLSTKINDLKNINHQYEQKINDYNDLDTMYKESKDSLKDYFKLKDSYKLLQEEFEEFKLKTNYSFSEQRGMIVEEPIKKMEYLNMQSEFNLENPVSSNKFTLLEKDQNSLGDQYWAMKNELEKLKDNYDSLLIEGQTKDETIKAYLIDKQLSSDTIEDLVDTIKNLKNENETYCEEKKVLEQNLHDIEIDLSTLSLENTNLKKEIDDFQEVKNELIFVKEEYLRVSKINDEIKIKLVANSNIEEECENLLVETNATKSKIDAQRKEYKNIVILLQKISSSIKQNILSTQMCTELKETLQILREDYDTLKSDFEKKCIECETLQENYKMLMEKHEHLQENNKELGSKYVEDRTCLENLRKEFHNLQEEIQDFKREGIRGNEKYDHLKNICLMLEDVYNKARKEIQDLKTMIVALKEENSIITSQLRISEIKVIHEEYQGLTNKLIKLEERESMPKEEDLNLIQTELTDLKEDYIKTDNERKKYIEKYSNLKHDMEMLLKENLTLRNQCNQNQLEEEKKAICEECESVRFDFENFKERLFSFIPSKPESMTDMLKFIEQKFNLLGKILEESKEKEEKIKELDEECDILTDRIKYLEKETGDSYQALCMEKEISSYHLLDNTKLKEELENLKREMEELQTKNNLEQINSNCQCRKLYKNNQKYSDYNKVPCSCESLKTEVQQLKIDVVDRDSQLTSLQLQILLDKDLYEKKCVMVEEYKKKILDLKKQLRQSEVERNCLKVHPPPPSPCHTELTKESNTQTEEVVKKKPLQLCGQPSGIIQAQRIREQEEKISKLKRDKDMLKRVCQSRAQSIIELKLLLQNAERRQNNLDFPREPFQDLSDFNNRQAKIAMKTNKPSDLGDYNTCKLDSSK